MTKKEIKQVFHERGVQINNEAVDLVLDQLRRETIKMADRCKVGNFKRLSAEHFWVAIGDWGIPPGNRRLTP